MSKVLNCGHKCFQVMCFVGCIISLLCFGSDKMVAIRLRIATKYKCKIQTKARKGEFGPHKRCSSGHQALW